MRLLRSFMVCASLGLSPALAEETPDICDAYAQCRKLTDGEIQMARGVFGDSIDYKSVSIINGRFLGVFPVGEQYWAITPDGNMYIARDDIQSDDYSKESRKPKAPKKPFFMHEMTHIWQSAQGINVIASAFALHVGNDTNPYKYKLDSETDFMSLSIEQQAKIVERYSAMEQEVQMTGKADVCDDFLLHRAAVDQAMNVLPIPAPCAQ